MIQIGDHLAAPPLYLSYAPGRSSTLVISFSGVGNRVDPVPTPEAIRLMGVDGENHVLFVSDSSRSWMNGPGLIEKLNAEVGKLAARINPSRIMAFGNSMGGSAALIYAGQAPVDAVLAIVPQYSVHVDVVPQEKRWMHFRNHITEWPYKAVPDLAGKGVQTVILHGGDARETMHARLFRQGPGVDHYVIPQYGHALALCLKQAGHLGPITASLIKGDMPATRTAIAAAGGITFTEFRQQFRAARKERRERQDHGAI